jgi:hypothetical protein
LNIIGITDSGHINGYLPHNMIDNSFTTSWRQHGYNSWININLEEQNLICRIDVAWEKAIDFTLSVSENGDTYQDLAVYASRATNAIYERYPIVISPPNNTIKIIFNHDGEINIKEISIYGR